MYLPLLQGTILITIDEAGFMFIVVIFLGLIFWFISLPSKSHRKKHDRCTLFEDEQSFDIFIKKARSKLYRGSLYIREKRKAPKFLYDNLKKIYAVEWIIAQAGKKDITRKVKINFNDMQYDLEVTHDLEKEARKMLNDVLNAKKNINEVKRSHASFNKCKECFIFSTCESAVREQETAVNSLSSAGRGLM
ncbi:hypothetical protein ACFL4O_01205 [bacterium]